MSLEVKKSLFFLSRKGERGCVFAVFFAPVPEEEILDFIAHGSIGGFGWFGALFARLRKLCREFSESTSTRRLFGHP